MSDLLNHPYRAWLCYCRDDIGADEMETAIANACDEIERLRAALSRISHAPHGKVYCADGHEEAVLIARAALEETSDE